METNRRMLGDGKSSSDHVVLAISEMCNSQGNKYSSSDGSN